MRAITRVGLLIVPAIAACAIAVAATPVARASSPDTTDECRDLDGTIEATFLGTTTLLFDDGRTQLMIDGFLTRPGFSAVVFGQVATDRTVVDSILDRVLDHGKDARLKALFVTHSHYDHALDAAYTAKRTGAHLYGSRSTLNIGRGGGLCEARMTRIRPGNTWQVGAFVVDVLESKHSPPTLFNPTGGVVNAPLEQPARYGAYAEEVTVDFLIAHCGRRILVKASANFSANAPADMRADVLFLSIARLGEQRRKFMKTFYAHTVGKVHPRLLIPLHWDDLFTPLTAHLPLASWPIDQPRTALDFLSTRVSAENRERALGDQLEFRVMQGYESLLLFQPGNPHGRPL